MNPSQFTGPDCSFRPPHRRNASKGMLRRRVLVLTAALVATAGPVFFTGCVQTHTLSDGAKFRVDHFGSLLSPSVTTFAVRPANSTNWGAPQVLSGPGLVPAAAQAAVVVVPWNDSGGNNTTVIADDPRPPIRLPPTRPPGHTPKDSGQRGR